MHGRGNVQLKLQSTVGGSSVAAIMYYIFGLVSCLAKSLIAMGWPQSAETNAAITIPFVALRVSPSIRRLHLRILVPREGE